jgi:RNA polymerase sigma factor for flagellar operon FliA
MRTTSHAAPDSRDPPHVVARIEGAYALIPGVVAWVKRDLALRMPDDELTSFGSEGALSAGRTFDPSRSVPFERWASLKIRGKVLDGLRAYGPLPRRSYRRLRVLIAAQDTAEGIIEEDTKSSQRNAEAADLRVSSSLATLATSMALGTLFTREAEMLEAIEDEGGTAEDEIIREELKVRVRAAVAARPERERRILERYYFQDMTLMDASGGRSRSWASRLLARATVGVGKALRAAAWAEATRGTSGCAGGARGVGAP